MVNDQEKLNDFLSESFVDYRLSKNEKRCFQQMLLGLGHSAENFAFARNRAFEIYRDFHSKDPQVCHDALNWLERIVKAVDSVRDALTEGEPDVFFSPGKSCANTVIDAIKNAHHTIDICVFTISDDLISDAILQAHDRGISIRIITDDEKAEDRGSDIHYLEKKGLPVRMDQGPEFMHHKFAIFDSSKLINGSFNWTRSASMKNEENITVLYDKYLLRSFEKRFNVLWKQWAPR
jgi:phosphatidylserine/phosphatidylglycerophosphate/cardiolipin synthase-like enzyme